MIDVQHVRKRFGSHAVLDAVNLRVARGERVAVLGYNGAGKTTLFRCVLGLTPFDGHITINNADVLRHGREARNSVGYVPQKAPRFEGTYRETIDFFCKLRSAPTREIHERLAGVGVDVEQHGEKSMSALSGGMLQKALLAVALGSGADVLILDEPTANLDPQARRDFLAVLRQAPDHVTVLLSSHRLGDIEAVASRVVVLHEGKIAFDGQVLDLTRAAATQTLFWVYPSAEDRASTVSILEEFGAIHQSQPEHGRVGVSVSRRIAARVLGALDAKGIELNDFAFETPTVEDVLALALSGSSRSSNAPVGNDGPHT